MNIKIGDRVKIVWDRFAGNVGVVEAIYPAGMFYSETIYHIKYDRRSIYKKTNKTS